MEFFPLHLSQRLLDQLMPKINNLYSLELNHKAELTWFKSVIENE